MEKRKEILTVDISNSLELCCLTPFPRYENTTLSLLVFALYHMFFGGRITFLLLGQDVFLVRRWSECRRLYLVIVCLRIAHISCSENNSIFVHGKQNYCDVSLPRQQVKDVIEDGCRQMLTVAGFPVEIMYVLCFP